MPALRNCSRCGRVFVGAAALCDACRQEDEAAYEAVRAFVAEHGGADLSATAAATGVPIALVRRFIEDGRLVVAVGAGLRCRLCGQPISTGRLCPACADGMAGRGAIPPPPRPRGGSGAGFYSHYRQRQQGGRD